MSPTAAEATQTHAPPSASPSAGAPVTPPPQAAEKTSAEKPAAAAKPGKESKSGKESKRSRSKSAKGATASSDGPSVAAHPRAARNVALAKGWGGLGGFLIAGYLSLPTGTLADAALRALVAGSVCYVVAWAGAVFIWRRLVMIEIKGREQRLLAAAQPASAPRESPATSMERTGARASS
ncbi:MAG TPA: hypothetical protein VIJ33_06045 [Solirubrobacteraceae bacterium]